MPLKEAIYKTQRLGARGRVGSEFVSKTFVLSSFTVVGVITGDEALKTCMFIVYLLILLFIHSINSFNRSIIHFRFVQQRLKQLKL